MQNTYCPIDERLIDSCTIRIGSFISSLILALYLTTDIFFLLILFSSDFLIKNINIDYSPVSFMAKRLQGVLGLDKQIIHFAPKEFALRLGGSFSLFLVFLHLIALPVSFRIISGMILFTLMFLEWALNYCVGCKLYQLKNQLFSK